MRRADETRLARERQRAQNVIERATVLSTDGAIRLEHLPPLTPRSTPPSRDRYVQRPNGRL
jgi:hypothetical protein